MRHIIHRSAAMLVALLVMLTACSLAHAESYKANTMRLANFEGDVQIEDASGQPRFVMKNARFDSGEALITGAGSSASVNLDDTKFVSLDENTRVAFAKSGGSLTLSLTDGAIFLDVSKKLTEGESLDIQTSTMTVGIRGTIIFVRDGVAPEGGRQSILGVLEGTAQLSYRDASGTSRSLPVPAGQVAVVRADEDGQVREAPDLARVDAVTIPDFVAEQVNGDDALRNRVENALDQDYAADGDWTWSGTVTLVAQSASKLYDGSPLTRPGDVLVYGLPSSFSITVRASGSQTDAGTTANTISSYSIRNARGEDVTGHFTSIETVSGQLVVDPAPLTVWTGSAEKVYDGTPLTNPETGMSSVPGYEKNTTPWRNMSYVSGGASGVQTLYALSGSIWVHGTNPLTGETREIQLNAGQKMEVMLNDDGTAASIELMVKDAEVSEIPDDVLRLYADNPDLMAQACRDAGWDAAELQARVDQLRESDKATVEKDGLTVESDAADRLMRDSTNVRITVDSDITSYNNRALGSDEAKYTPVHIDSGIVVTATGSQTEVGESPNTCEIDWGGTNPGNYILSEELGTLRVLEPEAPAIEDEITLTAASASKVYDGTPLTDASVEAEGLPEGYSAEAVAEGSITDAGSAANKVTSYKILDEAGSDATSQFTNVTLKDGTLKVEPLKLNVDLGGGTATYDGKPFIPTVTVTYENGPHAGETAGTKAGSKRYAAGPEQASTQTPVETASVQSYALFTGDAVQLTVSSGSKDAGTHTLTASLTATGGNSVNFDPVYTSIEYTIEPAPLTVTTLSASKVYDGTPLTKAGATLTGLVEGDTATATATGSLTDAGTAKNTYSIDWGNTKSSNYTLTEALGTLEITPLQLTIDLGGHTAEFDGDPQMPQGPKCDSVPSDGIHKFTDGMERDIGTSNVFTLPGGELAVSVLGFEDAGTHTLVPEAEFLSGNSGNYELSYTNQTMIITPMKVTVTLHDGSTLAYNGEEQLGIFSATGLGFDIGWAMSDGQRGFSWGGDSAIVTVTGGGRDVGSYTLSGSVSMESGKASNYEVSFTGTSMAIGPAPLTITTSDETKEYDGQPLTGTASVAGLGAGDTVTVTATGSITDVGTASNTYSIDWGETKSSNYTLSDTLGTLEVTKNYTPIGLGVDNDAVKTYNGSVQTGDLLVVDLPAGLTATADITGGGKDVGTYPCQIGDYKIYKGDQDVTANFEAVYKEIGSVTITPITGSLGVTGSYEYDGKMHYGTLTASCKGNPTVSKVSDTVWTVTWPWGDSFTITLSGGDVIPGSYTISMSRAFAAGTNEDNYLIIAPDADRVITITRNTTPITISAGSVSRPYDGTDLTSEIYSVSGAPDGFEVWAEVGGAQRDAGTGESVIHEYGVRLGDFEVSNYFSNITLKKGTLTVMPRTLTIRTGSATVYGLDVLTDDYVYVNGLVAGETATVTATGKQVGVGSSPNTYSISWGTAKADNYAINEELGTLTISDDPSIMPTYDSGGPLPVVEAQQVDDPTAEPSESIEPEPTPAPEEPTLADLDDDEAEGAETEPTAIEPPAESKQDDAPEAEPSEPAAEKPEEPKTEEPKTEEPKAEEPKSEAPKAEEPKTEEPKAEAPKTEAPKSEEPKTEAPKSEEPKAETPKTEAPKTEAPKAEAPKAEAPKTEAPKAEAPKAEAPKAEAPKAEAPKTEAPKAEAPKAEAPKAEAPKAEEPKPEAPSEDA